MNLPCRCSSFLLWMHIITCIPIWIIWIFVSGWKIYSSFKPTFKYMASSLFYSQLINYKDKHSNGRSFSMSIQKFITKSLNFPLIFGYLIIFKQCLPIMHFNKGFCHAIWKTNPIIQISKPYYSTTQKHEKKGILTCLH